MSSVKALFPPVHLVGEEWDVCVCVRACVRACVRVCVCVLLWLVNEFTSSICYVMLQISHRGAVAFTGPNSTVCISPSDGQHVITTVANS